MRTLALVFVALLATALRAEGPLTIDLWPGKPPGGSTASGPRRDTSTEKSGKVAGRPVVRVGDVSKPTLTVYRPAAGKDTGTAVVVCPGGGYSILARDLEGTEVCEWLAGLGVTAFLLEYRVPGLKAEPRHTLALHDAQRAVSLVRARAKEWGGFERVGILGFSAGGHLSVSTALAPKRTYDPADEADRPSARPDFAILAYPAYLVTADKTALRPEVVVTRDAPPMFLAHAADDPVPVENSLLLAAALRKAGVPAEAHTYARGGHGFGLRRTEAPCTTWPARCEEWLRASGYLRR